MCFAPQRRALFRHVNFQKWSKHVRTWCVLDILTSKCASCHNGVQFFISHLASWLCTRRFSEPIFRPFGATNYWKNTVNRHFLPFRTPASSFFSLFLFSSLTVPTSAFPSLHIVGSLTSKLPSIILYTCIKLDTLSLYTHIYIIYICIWCMWLSDYLSIYLSIDISIKPNLI